MNRSLVPGLVGLALLSASAFASDDLKAENPLVRPPGAPDADASGHVRVEIDGVVLAETTAPVLLFETGLPTRHYIQRTDVNFAALERTDTETYCPYKGTTSDYWSARIGGALHADIAWSYAYPSPQVLQIAGLVAFYDEKVDTYLDDVPVNRPRTKFSAAAEEDEAP